MQLTRHSTAAAPGAGAVLLAAAVANLLGPDPALANGLEGLQIEQATLVYRESGRVNVVEPVLQLRLPLPGEQSVGLRYGYDAMSGASPNGASPSVSHQTFTSPSGHRYTTVRGDLPTRAFRDTRHSVALDWERPLTRTLKLTSGASGSFETDYRSLGASLSLSLDLNQRLTTLSLGVGLNEDRVEPKGGVPVPLGDYEEREVASSAETKHLRDVLLGVTQVMNRHWLTQLNLGLGWDRGYLSDPYKGVSRVDSEGQPVDQVSETRPDARDRLTVLWANRIHLPRDVVWADYRFYRDDWGVTAHTVDLQYWWKADVGMPGLRLRPNVRFSTQTAADGYVHSVAPGGFDPDTDFLSADARLAGMDSWTLGLRVDLPEADWGQVWIKPAYMLQRFELTPDPVGVQSEVDLVPDLKAWMFTLGIKTRL